MKKLSVARDVFFILAFSFKALSVYTVGNGSDAQTAAAVRRKCQLENLAKTR